MYDLNDSTTLKITTAKFYLPSGRLIQKQDYLDNGFLTDGLDKKDSLFTTRGGRIVKGGGGITPDLIANRNTYSPFINALYKEKVFLTFATDYIPRNPDIKEKLEENMLIPDAVFAEFRKWLHNYNLEYKINGEIEYEKMKKKVLNESLSINKYSGIISNIPANDMINDLDQYFDIIKDIQINLPDNKIAVKNGLLREFSRILFNEQKRIEVSLINDIAYNRALEILINKNEYYSLLGY
jgi:carboxyl-terminal processing protease